MSRDRKKRINSNKDLIAVLFIFAVMILVAIGLTMCGRDEIEVGRFKNGSNYEEKEKDNSGEIVVMTAAGVAAVIVICFAIKKAKDNERRKKAIREHNERIEEQKRIEEARERVRQARLQEMIDAGVRQLTDKNSRRNTVMRDGSTQRRRWDDGFDSYDMNDKRLDSYYRNKYDDLLDDDLYDGLYDELDDETQQNDETTGLLGMLKAGIANLSTYWWIVVAVVAFAIIGGVIIMIFVL